MALILRCTVKIRRGDAYVAGTRESINTLKDYYNVEATHTSSVQEKILTL